MALISRSEAARLKNVTPQAVYKAINQGRVTPVVDNDGKVMLDKDPDLFGTSITISCSKGKGNLVAGRPVNNYYKYKNDRFQNTPVNELGELADYLYSIDTFNPWSVVEWREIMSKEDDKDKDYYLSLGS